MSDSLASPSDDLPSLWTQYERLIDLHKFYFENIIKAVSFYLGIEGAILTYIISVSKNFDDDNTMHLMLAFPLLFSIGATVIAAVGIVQTKDLSRTVNQVQEELQIGWRPHAEVLVFFTILFTILSLLVSVGIVWLMVADPSPLNSLEPSF